jgi:predicted nuclease of predicted toxin-antitoxin system
MSRLYTNENFPQGVVLHLRLLGHEVLTTHDAGKSNKSIPDNDVLRYAVENDRIMVTYNRCDFIKLHKADKNHCGVIVCTVDSNHQDLAVRIHNALKEHNPAYGKLIRINLDGFSVS